MALSATALYVDFDTAVKQIVNGNCTPNPCPHSIDEVFRTRTRYSEVFALHQFARL